MKSIQSPHYASRGKWEILGTVIHYTAGGRASGTARWFANLSSGVSSHYVIGRRGAQYRCVDDDQSAWHAGRSEMVIGGESLSDSRGSANSFTLGIALANRGTITEIDGRYYWELGGTLRTYRGPDPVRATLRYDNGIRVTGLWEPFPDEQMDSLQALLLDIKNAHGDSVATNLIGHEEIAMPFGTRKRDPGPLFPWDRFYRKIPKRTQGIING